MSDKLITIEGTVDTVLFCNEENGYIVLDLDTGSDYVTAVGELGVIEEGEELRLTGEYVSHPKFGDQFKAVTCERKLPATESAILKYLSSGTVKGIGPSLAKKMVDRFGRETLSVIENEPEKLAEIKGVSASKAEDICQEFRRIHGVRSLMIFLAGFGVAPSVAMAAWKRWGQFAIEMIKSDPYILCDQGIELGFEQADRMASGLAIPADSPSRVKAGVIHILSHNAVNGHTCCPVDKVIPTACKLLGNGETCVSDNIAAAVGEEELEIYTKNDREYLFLPEFSKAEDYISSRLSLMN
ncbi:MAG: ATP-dependent RecD-like DNA helicase, partial [Oscillospiraceae bacterium]|nr:ATP-dependent RecD-like DNA helicase [Oscillospiraceae bacterium]